MVASPAKLARRSLPLLLLQVREQVMAYFRPLLNEQGITEQQWRVIRVLLETGPLEVREISSGCQISSPSLAGVLARMEDLGLVARERVGSDQRRIRVELTPRSRELAARLAPRINATYRQIESRLGVEACRQLYAVLDRTVLALAPTPEVLRVPGRRATAGRRAARSRTAG